MNTNNNSRNSYIVLPVLGVLVLSAMLLYVINDNSRQLYDAAEKARQQQELKTSIMFRFMYILSGRTSRLLKMYNVDDVFERYDLELEMADDASEFVRIRDQLSAMDLAADEREALDGVLAAVRAYMPHEREVINLLIQDELLTVRDMLLEQVLPLQGAIYTADSMLFHAIIASGKKVEQELRSKREEIQFQIYLLSLCIVIITAIFVSVFFHRLRMQAVVDERTAELRETLSRLKVLEGFLSICSYCKSIRTDSGSWSMLEEYISEHSNAKFTHGICPDCAADIRKDLNIKK